MVEDRRYRYYEVVEGTFKTILRFSSLSTIEDIKKEVDHGATITEVTSEEYYQFHTTPS